jgi:predicted AAA+ superfamily ATPase
MSDDQTLAESLRRIADALERLAPAAPPAPDFGGATFYRYDAAKFGFHPAETRALPLDLLLGIEAQKAQVTASLSRFARGLPVNHMLLWGARGTGKSSLTKAAVVAEAAKNRALKLVELDRDHLPALPALFDTLRGRTERFVVFCDDLSFEAGVDGVSGQAKSLKSALEGGVGGPPDNVLFIATSNRRHLAPERHDEGSGMLAAAEQAEETVSVSDRFGLWIGFPPMDQPTYLAAVAAYAASFGLKGEGLDRRALQWAQRRGGRSGRVAWQFIKDLAGERGVALPL